MASAFEDLLARATSLAGPEAALRTKEGVFTFAQLEAKTKEMERFLSSLGLEAGDRIAVQLPTGLLFLTLLFASLRIGALFSPLDMKLPPQVVENRLACLSPRIFASENGTEKKDLTAKSPLTASLLLFTSGTTSEPKIALLSVKSFALNAIRAGQKLGLQPGDEWLLSLPLHHVGGLAIVFRCLAALATLSLKGAEKKVTHLSYVPTQLYRASPIYPHLRTLLLGGAPIYEIPTYLPVIPSYGMTETGSMVFVSREKKAPFWGFPMTGWDFKLAADGELLIRGNSLFKGYWTQEGLESPFDPEGWFHTKDIGAFDPEKGFSILGRKDNQFISGGENIQPEEIEKELCLHPSILQALVVPKKDPEFGTKPVALIQAIDPSFDLNEMKRFLEGRLPKYKIPVALLPLPEFQGKIERKLFLNGQLNAISVL